MKPEDQVSLRIWRADAIVLFDWLMSVDFETIPIQHRADKQALTDLLTQLEWSLVPPTEQEVDEAREAVSRDMSW